MKGFKLCKLDDKKQVDSLILVKSCWINFKNIKTISFIHDSIRFEILNRDRLCRKLSEITSTSLKWWGKIACDKNEKSLFCDEPRLDFLLLNGSPSDDRETMSTSAIGYRSDF